MVSVSKYTLINLCKTEKLKSVNGDKRTSESVSSVLSLILLILVQLSVSCRFFQNKEKCLVEINDTERAQLRSRALESMLGTSGGYFLTLVNLDI